MLKWSSACTLLISRSSRRSSSSLITSRSCRCNSVQALLLFNIGDQELTAGELRTRGHYLGSNVSYNLKKLVESGYIHHERSDADRRSVHVRLTEKGREIREVVTKLFDRHLESIEAVGNV